MNRRELLECAELIDEALAIIEKGIEEKTAPSNMRWPILDELSGVSLMLKEYAREAKQ